jgi:hypothetical protein
MQILNAGADFVLGRAMLSHWVDWHRALSVVKGMETPADERDAWEWLRNPCRTPQRECYPHARRTAARQTHLALAAFPDTCPWTAEQVLDTDFWPDASSWHP